MTTTTSHWDTSEMAREALSHELLTAQQRRSLLGQLRGHNPGPALRLLESRGWTIEPSDEGDSWALESRMTRED